MQRLYRRGEGYIQIPGATLIGVANFCGGGINGGSGQVLEPRKKLLASLCRRNTTAIKIERIV